MADVAAPAAPAAAPTGGASNGAPTPNGAPKSGAAPAPAGKGNPRSTDGRFSPKDGAAGVAPQEGGATPETPAKEPYRFKRALKVYGQEEAVDLDEDGIARELQIARAEKKQLAELRKRLSEHEDLPRLAKENREEAMRRLGVDPDEFAKERIAKLIAEESMSEEQRTAAQTQRERDEARAELQKIKERDSAIRKELQMKQVRSQITTTYGEALKAAGVDVTNKAAAYEMVYDMVETERALCFDKEGRRVLELSPAQLAQETVARKNKTVVGYINQLGPRGFMKAHPELYQQLLQASVEDYEASQGAHVPTPRTVEPPVEPREKAERWLTEAEVDARLKKLRQSGR